jgi:thioredoxin 1
MNKERGIIYFSAPWCSPCKVLGPVIDSLIGEGMNIKKVNCDYDTILTQKYNVKSIPTLVLTDLNGSELGRKVGTQSREDLLSWYNG